MGRIIRARSPLRVSFAGGGTDVRPYPELHGGVALNATINRFAYCTLEINESEDIVVHSLDYDQTAQFSVSSTPLFDGNLDLIKGVFRRVRPGILPGLNVTLFTDAPPGSGLGTSSALVVAVISAISQYLGLALSPHEMANLAYVVEREDLGIVGGSQDQYASCYGGFNFMEFGGKSVDVYPLRIRAPIVYELEAHFLLCFTGDTRLSAGILKSQIENVEQRDTTTVKGLHAIKAITFELRRALLSGDLLTFGDLLNTAWENKRQLAYGISNPKIDEMYRVARKNGALGGKLLGAGGGGYLLIYVEPDRRVKVAAALQRLGATLSPFLGFIDSGAVAWENRLNVSTIPEGFQGGPWREHV